MARSPADALGQHAEVVWRSAARQAATEWRALRRGRLPPGKAPRRVLAWPRDPRPADVELGQALLDGHWFLAGHGLDLGIGADPFDRVSPSRDFAEALHRFDWLPSLLAVGPTGAAEALRLTLAWEAAFGRWSAFAWSAEVLERRVYNLACGLEPMLGFASDAEIGRLLGSLAGQAQALAAEGDPTVRAAERAVVVATAAAMLEGAPQAALLEQALAILTVALKTAVLADGGHRARSPERGLELLLDLLTLDGVLQARGLLLAPAASNAMDRLTSATRFFTAADGRLSAFHGGRAVTADRIAAALALEDSERETPPEVAPHTGYHRLTARTLRVMIDAGLPAEGDWGVEATAHALAIEVTAGPERLFLASAETGDRRTPAGSTATVNDDTLGAPLQGRGARALGSRLVGGLDALDVRRNADDSPWIELTHRGWVDRYGFKHERRLFVDDESDELRGEDRFDPATPQPAQTPFAVRFQLAPGVEAAVTADGRGALLRLPSRRGWWLRTDATTVAVEGRALVLRGRIQPQSGGRVRWKLTRRTGEDEPG